MLRKIITLALNWKKYLKFEQYIAMLIKMKNLNRIKTSNGFESRGILYTSVFLRYSFPYHDCFVYVDHW